MDKAILKKFAIESRQDLMKKIKNKVKTFYVDEVFSVEQKGELYVLSNEKHSLSLTNEEYKKRELLIKRIKELSLEQVIEEAAYTWFNRIIAIRYMEINDMLPLTKDNQSLGIRVLSSKDNTPDPEILKFTNLTNPDLDIDFIKEIYAELKDEKNKFKYVLLLVCKKLGKVIPQVFDGITDYIDILIPDNLLNDTGFITKVIKDVPEENYNQVEIIGWLYQYYNQIEKDRVISAKKTYKKNEIPYATQLFTPDWIVKYMVENSLGKYWIEHNGDMPSLIENWKYFIRENLEYQKNKLNPTEITFFDPCCGSGHILVYAFEVLYQIYLKSGYNKSDISELILKNNLYGLDIDDRAGQLSILSVLLKAREYDKNIFNKDIIKNLNIMSIQESNNISETAISSVCDKNNQDNILYLINSFANVKEIGSLLLLEKRDYTNLEKAILEDDTIFGIELKEKLLPIIKIANILDGKYDIVVTNPPYMNSSVMSENLKKYIGKHYGNAKSDLFSAFIIRNSIYGKQNAYLGFMTPYVWMFISAYENLRKYVIDEMNIVSLLQLEYSSLEEAIVPLCTFVLVNNQDSKRGIYYRLTDFVGGMTVQEKKFLEGLNNKNCLYKYLADKNVFENIDSMPIVYWASEKMFNIFKNEQKLGDKAIVRNGMKTGDNNRFLRLWWEVEKEKSNYIIEDYEETNNIKAKWFAYNKGGEYRKWYGNNDYVVNWENQGFEIFKLAKSEKRNVQDYPNSLKFKPSVSWSLITSSKPAFRFKKSCISDIAGMSYYYEKYDDLLYSMAFCNSLISLEILKMLAPTINFQAGDIARLPIINKDTNKVNTIVKQNIELSKTDWDSFETSWDFVKHPLLLEANLTPRQIQKEESNGIQVDNNLEEAYNHWCISCNNRFKQLKENEEELNRIFIDIYGLQDELTPEVEDKDITIRLADKERDIKSFISYAVGCMFGRYSLDEDGLIYTGGDFDINRYKLFKADIDNVIPITDQAYFGDDIVERFKEFLKVAYGMNTFNKNLDFVAESLGKKGTETSEDTIRRYFLNDFYNDHIKTYQKRPIYWLFDSGKKNGFKALIYMHRYNENLVPKVRLDYLHRIQTTYEKLLSDVNYRLTTDLSMTDKKVAENRKADLIAKLQEIKKYDEKIAHIANQRISIDLDDGVKENYEKFKDILAKIK